MKTFVTISILSLVVICRAENLETRLLFPVQNSTDTIFAKFDTILARKARMSSCVATGVLAKGKIILHRFTFDGRAGKMVSQAPPPYEIGSVSKVFTATSILQLVEQGKFSLDSKLTTLIQDPVLRQLLVLDGKDLTDSVTIRQLLNHTSGLPDYFYSDDEVMVALFGDSTLSLNYQQLVRMAKRAGKPSGRPGQVFKYCNTNYILLGWIIERYSSMSYKAYIRKHIFQPLGMRSTRFISDLLPESRSTGHWQGKTVSMSGALASSAGEIISNGDDMILFLDAWATGTLYKDPKTLQMVRNSDYHNMGPGLTYGLGVIRFRNISLGHAGQTFGFSSYAGVLDNGYRFMINMDEASAESWGPSMEIGTLLSGIR